MYVFHSVYGFHRPFPEGLCDPFVPMKTEVLETPLATKCRTQPLHKSVCYHTCDVNSKLHTTPSHSYALRNILSEYQFLMVACPKIMYQVIDSRKEQWTRTQVTMAQVPVVTICVSSICPSTSIPYCLLPGLCSGRLAHQDCIKGVPCTWLLVAIAIAGISKRLAGQRTLWSGCSLPATLPWAPSVFIKATNFQRSLFFIKLPSQLLVTTPSFHLKARS